MRVVVAALLIAVLGAGCVAQLSQAGAKVRRIQGDWATQCEFLGVVEASWGTGATVADYERGAMNELRNRVAELGGNAYTVSSAASDIIHATVQGDAYRCPPPAAEKPVTGAASR